MDTKQIANRVYAGVRGVVTGTTTATFAGNEIFLGPFTGANGDNVDSFQEHQSITHAGTLFLSIINKSGSANLEYEVWEAPDPDALWVDSTNNEYHHIKGTTGPDGLTSGSKFAFRDLTFGSSYVITLRDGSGPGSGAAFKVSWEFKG